MPSTFCDVKILLEVKSQFISGTLNLGSEIVFFLSSLAADPSNLKSISIVVISLSKCTTSTSFKRLALGKIASIIDANNIKASSSSLNFFSIPGLRIFIAKFSPEIFAKWT